LTKANKERYGDLVNQITNNVRRGAEEYPKTVAEAYDILLKYKPPFAHKMKSETGRNTAFGATERPLTRTTTAAEPRVTDGSGEEKRRCHRCGERGHLRKNCPMKGQTKQSVEAFGQEKSGMAVSFSADSTLEKSGGGAVLVWDSGTTRHLINRPELLRDVRELDKPVKVQGAGGIFWCTHGGVMPDIGEALIFRNLPVSLISEHRLEQLPNVKITYKPGVERKLSVNGKDFIFTKSTDGLYVCHLGNGHSYIATVEANRTLLTPKELKRVEAVKKLRQVLGIPSIFEMTSMVESGNLMDCEVTTTDINNYQKVYGEDVSYLKGRLTGGKPRSILNSQPVKITPTIQTFHTDVMINEGVYTLISVVKPMNAILTCELPDHKGNTLRKGITNHLEILISRGYQVETIYSDNEACFRTLGSVIGIPVRPTGSGSHEPIVERAVRTVEERLRSVLAGLPYRLPTGLIKHLISYVVTMINMVPRSSGCGVSAREQLTGKKVNVAKELKLPFGEYCLVKTVGNKSNNIRDERCEGCICIGPALNGRGTQKFWTLRTHSIISSDNYRVVPMPQEAIEAIQHYNEHVEEVEEQVRNPKLKSDADVTDLEESEKNHSEKLEKAVENTESEEKNGKTDTGNISNDKGDVNEQPYMAEIEAEVAEQHTVCDMAMHLTISKAMSSDPYKTNEGIDQELKQMLEKGVFEPAYASDLNIWERRSIIPSSLFLKEKTSEGKTIYKARLVAGGHRQPDGQLATSSPTVNVESIFMTLGIAASQRRHFVTMDIKGAYLEAEMKGTVHMKLSKILSKRICMLEPAYKRYVDDNGNIVVKLKKALYGCKQSSLLWYNKLSSILRQLGYCCNQYDECVWNKLVDGVQVTVAFHVDDLLLTCDRKEILDTEVKSIGGNFSGYTTGKFNEAMFLGMHITRDDNGNINVDMEKYTASVCSKMSISDISSTPAGDVLFREDHTEPLGQKESEDYHSTVAKLLFLAKRTRPDILASVSYLCSRVSDATEHCRKGLHKLLGYLSGTVGYGIRFTAGGDPTPTVYADAAHNVHVDGKSRSGVVVMVCGGVVSSLSNKQSRIKRSSTESELDALEAGCTLAVVCRNFMESQTLKLGSSVVYQDNKSVLSMMERGKPTSHRSKHIDAKYYRPAEMQEDGVIKLRWISTQDMIADVLTKPMTKKFYTALRDKMVCNITQHE